MKAGKSLKYAAPELRACTCRHEYQERRYGRWLRVHNLTQKGPGSSQVWRCTVCRKES